jgi:hypothetical protein
MSIKISFGFLFLFFSQTSFAAIEPWADLLDHQTVEVAKQVKINPKLTLRAGTQVFIKEVQTLSPVPVVVYQVRLNQITNTESSPLEVMQDGNGVEVKENGLLDFYIEFKDLYRPSYFQLIASQNQ